MPIIRLACISYSALLFLSLCFSLTLLLTISLSLSVYLSTSPLPPLGRLLDVLTGHEGPIACLDFSQATSTLASGQQLYLSLYLYLSFSNFILEIISFLAFVVCANFPSCCLIPSPLGSWDGTLKLWDVYQNNCIETMEHGCDVLAVSFRPDGKEVCAAATNGNIHIWDVEVT